MTPKIRFWSAALVTALVALAAGRADAAPQILGLVASNGLPTPLSCADGVCTGHFSSFCLQQAREAPPVDSEYRLAAGSRLTLIATLTDGAKRRIAGNGLVAIRTLLGFTSVEIDLPQAVLKRIGATAVAVEVEPDASILPAPVAGDPDPQTSQEIALATGPMRRLAERPFERPGPDADAARLTSLAINMLPATDPATDEAREALFHRMVAMAARSLPLTSAGIAEAHDMFRSCELSVDGGWDFNLRGCLEMRHGDLMVATNRSFWQSTGGS